MLDENFITPVSSEEIKWIAKRPKDSSLNVNKAYQALKNKPLKIHEALEKMKRDKKKQAVYR